MGLYCFANQQLPTLFTLSRRRLPVHTFLRDVNPQVKGRVFLWHRLPINKLYGDLLFMLLWTHLTLLSLIPHLAECFSIAWGNPFNTL